MNKKEIRDLILVSIFSILIVISLIFGLLEKLNAVMVSAIIPSISIFLNYFIVDYKTIKDYYKKEEKTKEIINEIYLNFLEALKNKNVNNVLSILRNYYQIFERMLNFRIADDFKSMDDDIFSLYLYDTKLANGKIMYDMRVRSASDEFESEIPDFIKYFKQKLIKKGIFKEKELKKF